MGHQPGRHQRRWLRGKDGEPDFIYRELSYGPRVEGKQALKVTVGPDSHASLNLEPLIKPGNYRFSARFFVEGLTDAAKTSGSPVSRVIFRSRDGESVSDSSKYSWRRSVTQEGAGRWADHNHVFRTLPGTERIRVTMFFHGPGTYWVDDLSLRRL